MMGKIRQQGIVTKALKGIFYQVALEDNPAHQVLATVCGRMQKGQITLNAGDTVDLELCPYDLNRGRIVWRH